MTLIATTGADSIVHSNDQIVLALIAIIATSIAALVYTIKNNTLNKGIAKDAYEANKAVNNIGPGDHRLYDKVSSIATEVKNVGRVVRAHQKHWDEFNSRWGNLPENLDDSVGLVVMIQDIHNSVTQVDNKIVAMGDQVDAVNGRVGDMGEKLTLVDQKLDAYIDWANQNYVRSTQARADIQEDVTLLLDHDQERDVEGKRYEAEPEPIEGIVIGIVHPPHEQ